jgi:hypothetical protein
MELFIVGVVVDIATTKVNAVTATLKMSKCHK